MFALLLSASCLSVHASEWHYKNYFANSESGWNYNDPNHDWPLIAPLCGSGTRQSPVNIVSSQVQVNTDIAFRIQGAVEDIEGSLFNNGHTIEWDAEEHVGPIFKVKNVPHANPEDEFIFEQLHFHFTQNSTGGSEHKIDGMGYAAELHFVTYNKKYGTFANAAVQPDGLTVVGVLFKEGKHNDGLEDIVEQSALVINADADHRVPTSVSYKHIMPLSVSNKFYTYPGSLTTPGCLETVTWIVAEQPLELSAKQLAALRRLKTSTGTFIGPNFRPVQPLNSRTVEKSEPKCCTLAEAACSGRATPAQKKQVKQACGIQSYIQICKRQHDKCSVY